MLTATHSYMVLAKPLSAEYNPVETLAEHSTT